MSTLMVLGLTGLVWLALLVAVGRATVPRTERVRFRCWGWDDLAGAAAIGGRQVKGAIELAHRRTYADWR